MESSGTQTTLTGAAESRGRRAFVFVRWLLRRASFRAAQLCENAMSPEGDDAAPLGLQFPSVSLISIFKKMAA